MFGIPIEGPINCYIANVSVVSSSMQPESTLKKMAFSYCIPQVREAAAAGIVRIAYETSSTKIADILTKLLPAEKLHCLCQFHLF